MNDLVTSPRLSTESIRCSSRPVPNVATAKACVCPRVKSPDPWVLGSTPTSLESSRIVVDAPSVGPYALAQNPLAHHGPLDHADGIANVLLDVLGILAIRDKRIHDFADDIIRGRQTLVLVINAQCSFDPGAGRRRRCVR